MKPPPFRYHRPVELRVLGGAISRLPVDATTFAHRQRNLLCSVVAAGFAEPDSDRHRRWCSRCRA